MCRHVRASSWLIHGGIRYLEHGEARLVRESLRERELLLRAAPHLLVPYPLLIPFYRHNRRSRHVILTGMIAYDVLSPRKSTPRHQILSRAEVVRRYPGLERDGLTGAALYLAPRSPSPSGSESSWRSTRPLWAPTSAPTGPRRR